MISVSIGGKIKVCHCLSNEPLLLAWLCLWRGMGRVTQVFQRDVQLARFFLLWEKLVSLKLCFKGKDSA